MSDVVIAGMGPAGCAVAACLASNGVRVELVGPVPRPDRGHRGCETLGPQGIRRVLDLGIPIDALDAVCRPVDGFRASWGTIESVPSSPMDIGAKEFRVISRAAFDELLAKNAEQRGAACVRDSVVDAVHDGTNWTVKLRRGSPLIARVMVDATGRAARLVRRHGATLTPIDRLVVWSASCDVSDRPAIVEVDATGCGWGFSAPTVAGGRVLAFFGDSDLLTTRHEDSLPHSWPMESSRSRLWSKYADDFGDCKVIAEAAATTYLDHAVLPGLLAIGDAAQTFDPLSSQGIVSALEDAESAARAIAAAFDGHPEWLDRHEHQRRIRFCRYLLERRAQYGAETRFTASPFWHRRMQLVGKQSWRPRWALPQ